MTCARCGGELRALSGLVLYCPKCKANSLQKEVEAFAAKMLAYWSLEKATNEMQAEYFLSNSDMYIIQDLYEQNQKE